MYSNLGVFQHGFVDEVAAGEFSNRVLVKLNVEGDDMSFVTHRAHLFVVHRVSQSPLCNPTICYADIRHSVLLRSVLLSVCLSVLNG